MSFKGERGQLHHNIILPVAVYNAVNLFLEKIPFKTFCYINIYKYKYVYKIK